MTYAFEDFIVDTMTSELRSGGAVVPIEPKAFDLLVFLIENRSRIVTRDELVEVLWGGRFISDAAISTALRSVRRSIGDSGDKQGIIKTLRGRGFRFVAELKRPMDQAPPASDKVSIPPSIAVMPFENLSDEPDQVYFVDGICDDVILLLGRMRWLFVIAKNSTVSYRDRRYDIPSVAQDLGVSYILTGRVRCYGGRIRVSVQLLLGQSGEILWTEKYDSVVGDVFAVQDRIAESIAAALEPQVSIAELRKSYRKPEQDLNAWDCVIRAMALKSECTETSSREAITVLTKALEIDPNYARAHALLGWVLIWRVHQGWADPLEALERATRAAEAAVENDPDELWAYVAWGFVATLTKDQNLMLDSPRRALEINPSFALGHSWMGAALAVCGRGAEAFEWIERARRLSPRDILKNEFETHEAFAHFQTENYEAAFSLGLRAVTAQPQHVYPRLIMLASLGHMGRFEEAELQRKKITDFVPDLTLQSARQSCVFLHVEDIDRFIEGLELAGLN